MPPHPGASPLYHPPLLCYTPGPLLFHLTSLRLYYPLLTPVLHPYTAPPHFGASPLYHPPYNALPPDLYFFTLPLYYTLPIYYTSPLLLCFTYLLLNLTPYAYTTPHPGALPLYVYTANPL